MLLVDYTENENIQKGEIIDGLVYASVRLSWVFLLL
jgi:hypothetical protein